MLYDEYNREERYVCSHLFRLLHDWIAPSSSGKKMAEFLALSGMTSAPVDWSALKIFSEVALIRDAYFARKPQVSPFMDSLVSHIAAQEGVVSYTHFGDMPQTLTDPALTHPKQILEKARSEGMKLSDSDQRVYGSVQAAFNAKPDLAIAGPKDLIVYEAKFTQAFDPGQLERTTKIADIWATILYADLGFATKPKVLIARIGHASADPDVSWNWLAEAAASTYAAQDRTRIALANAVAFLQRPHGA